MTEFIIALVAFVVIIAALLQMGTLCRAKVQTMVRSRGIAGLLAINNGYDPMPRGFVRTWTDGNDRITYTEDDLPVYTDASDFMAVAVRATDRPVNYAGYRAPYVKNNAFLQFIDFNAGDYANTRGWAVGTDYQDVPIDPAVQRLILAARFLTVSSSTVLPPFHTTSIP